MKLILLYLLILATLHVQISTTYGKTINTKSSSTPESSDMSSKTPAEMRVRRNLNSNDDYEDFLINRLSRENDIMTSNFLDTALTCNNLNDLESDTLMEESLRSLFDPLCTQLCKIDIFGRMLNIIRCQQMRLGRDVNFERDRRGKIENLLRDELFVPVRGRRNIEMDQSMQQNTPEKKAKLDVLMNDLFVPHRGKRQLVRKHFLILDPYPLSKRSSNIELNMKDFFVPHRGKRQRNGKIDDLLSDNFFPQRGKKSTAVPKSQRTIVEYATMEPWLFQNINTNDRHMIDRLHDLNLGSEANKDITSAGARATTATGIAFASLQQGEKLIPQMYINNNNKNSFDGEKVLLDITPKKILNLNPSNGHQLDDSDDFASTTNLILTKTPLNNREHAVDDEFTSTFI